MSAPLPSALRIRFQKCIEEGLSGRAAAAAQGRPPRSGKLAFHRAFVEELVAQDPDITLFEPRRAR